MTTETLIAVFKTSAEAEMVETELRSAGIHSSAIEIHRQTYGHDGADATLAMPESGEAKSGFWGWLLGEESAPHDHALYDTTMASGGAVLSVIVPDTDVARVTSIIETHGPVDLSEHNSPAAADMTPVAPMMAPTGTAPTGTAPTGTAPTGTAPLGAAPAVAPLGAAPKVAPTGHLSAASTAASEMGSEVVSLAEETLTVGKRLVDGGAARIRRYVVERPVEEQIRLRTERLMVERRPVAVGGTLPDDAFREKVIEVRETSEEAVIGKKAEVFEEVVIGKDVSERVETVRDTVRREEIEVTHPSGTKAPELAGAVPPRR